PYNCSRILDRFFQLTSRLCRLFYSELGINILECLFCNCPFCSILDVKHASMLTSPVLALFIRKGFDHRVVVNQLDYGRDILSLKIDCVPKSTQSYDLNLMHATLKDIERICGERCWDLRGKHRRVDHEFVVRMQS